MKDSVVCGCRHLLQVSLYYFQCTVVYTVMMYCSISCNWLELFFRHAGWALKYMH